MSVRLSRNIPIFRKKNKWDAVTWRRPIAGASALYVGEALRSNELVGIERATLSLLWRLKTAKHEPQSALDGALIAGSLLGQVARFEGHTGRLIWEVPGEVGWSRPWRDRLLVQRAGAFDVLDPDNGATIDRIGLPRPDLTACGFSGDRVLLTRDVLSRERHLAGPVACFDLHERQMLWEAPLIDQIRERHEIDDQNAIIKFVPGSSAARLIIRRGRGTLACSVEDGHLLWCAPLPLDYGAPYVHEGRVYGIVEDRFIALDEATGAVIYDVRHPELADSAYPFHGPAFRGQLAYAMQSGHLVLFDLKDGRITGFHKYGESLGGVAEADGRLFATAGDGNLLVFEYQ